MPWDEIYKFSNVVQIDNIQLYVAPTQLLVLKYATFQLKSHLCAAPLELFLIPSSSPVSCPDVAALNSSAWAPAYFSLHHLMCRTALQCHMPHLCMHTWDCEVFMSCGGATLIIVRKRASGWNSPPSLCQMRVPKYILCSFTGIK